MRAQACVQVPATTANLGSGFDVLGLALSLHNQTCIEVCDEPGVRCIAQGRYGADVPTGDGNFAVIGAGIVFAIRGERPAGYTMTIHQEIPVASGLGSSSAALVGGAAAACALLDHPRDDPAVLRQLAALEGHGEQVAAAMLGGLVAAVSRADDTAEVVRLAISERLRFVIVTPHTRIETHGARAVLPSHMAFADAVAQARDAVALVHGLETADPNLIAAGTRDRLHQDARTQLLPSAPHVLSAGLDAGAYGTCWSGAGPTMLAICGDDDGARAAADAMVAAFATAGLASTARICRADHDGAIPVATSAP